MAKTWDFKSRNVNARNICDYIAIDLFNEPAK